MVLFIVTRFGHAITQAALFIHKGSVESKDRDDKMETPLQLQD